MPPRPDLTGDDLRAYLEQARKEGRYPGETTPLIIPIEHHTATLEVLGGGPRIGSVAPTEILERARRLLGKATVIKGSEDVTESNAPSREEIDAKMDAMSARAEASEARISESLEGIRADVKVATAEWSKTLTTVNASIAAIEAKTAHLPTTLGLWAALATTVVAVLGVLLALLAWGGDRFDGGISAASVTAQQAAQTELQSERNAEALDMLTKMAQTQQQQLQRQEQQLNDLLARTPPSN